MKAAGAVVALAALIARCGSPAPVAAPVAAVAAPVAATSTTVPAPSPCDVAVAYLEAHAAPGFRFVCPGYALGHEAMTCVNVAGVCPGARLIVLADPCRAAYENEASNSWVLLGLRRAPIDPFGSC